MYSLMVATEPLPPEFWSVAGLAQRETFADFRHLIVYGQRTVDDRLAFGGRGAPVPLRLDRRPFDTTSSRASSPNSRRVLAELFPALEPVPIAYRWGGPLGVARDWNASVGLDRERGLAWAGGYVGDGVGTSNLAGRTLADLITGSKSRADRNCPGSGTGRGAGSRSRCAGWASTPACG